MDLHPPSSRDQGGSGWGCVVVLVVIVFGLMFWGMSSDTSHLSPKNRRPSADAAMHKAVKDAGKLNQP